MLRTILIAVAMTGIAMVLLAVRVILVKGGRFRRGHACKGTDPQTRHFAPGSPQVIDNKTIKDN